MTGFSVDWLNSREAADQEARDSELLHSAVAFASTSTEGDAQSVIVDLGAGTGSTYRAFDGVNTSIACPLTWRLIDNDRALLEEAARRAHKDHLIETYELDLNRVDELPLGEARLITASAFFDLVSGSFIDRLISAVNQSNSGKPLGFYATLNYDGSTCWDPIHPLDQVVLGAFNSDQVTEKGFGTALGPSACDYLQQVLEHAGFSIKLADSPWRLEGKDSRLVAELIQGIGSAVRSSPEISAEDIAVWLDFRLSHVAFGSCSVGHTDLLAIRE